MRPAKEINLEDAFKAFAAKAKYLREKAALSQSDMEQAMKEKVSQKTISNIERGVHDTQISNLAAVAAHFRVPRWVMFIPELDTAVLEQEKLQRLEKLVSNYLACKDGERLLIEGMATGYAGLQPKK